MLVMTLEHLELLLPLLEVGSCDSHIPATRAWVQTLERCPKQLEPADPPLHGRRSCGVWILAPGPSPGSTTHTQHYG